MKILPYQIPDSSQLILLSPVSTSDRAAFLILLEQIKTWWKQAENHLDLLFENEGVYVTIQNMINLIPRKDIRDEFGFDLTSFKESPEALSTLILSQLDYLHELETSKEKQLSEDEEKPFSLPSSGDYEADLIADLSQAIGAEGAMIILDNYGLQMVNLIIKRLNYTNLSPEKLEKLKKAHEAEQAKKRFKRYAKEGKLNNIRWVQDKPFDKIK